VVVVTAITLNPSKPNKILAFELGLTEYTLKAYISRIFKRLNVENRFGLMLWGRENGYGPAPVPPYEAMRAMAKVTDFSREQARTLVVMILDRTPSAPEAPLDRFGIRAA
jgi:hypothetical protein